MVNLQIGSRKDAAHLGHEPTLPIGLHSASSPDDSARHASVISTHTWESVRGRHRRNSMWRKLEPCLTLQSMTWTSSSRTVNDCRSDLARRMATPVVIKGRYKGDLGSIRLHQ